MNRKILNLVMFIAFIFITAMLIISIYKNIADNYVMQQKVLESSNKYEKLKLEKEKLQKELEQAQKDISKEKIIRDQLNMKKEGETIYRIDGEKTEETDNKDSENTK